MARLLILIIGFSLAACSYEKSKLEWAPEQAPPPPASEGEAKLLTFREVQDGVFLTKCQQCHERVGSELQFQNYDNVKSFLSGIQFRVFEKRDMPRGPKLAADELALLKTWIDQGGPL